MTAKNKEKLSFLNIKKFFQNEDKLRSLINFQILILFILITSIVFIGVTNILDSNTSPDAIEAAARPCSWYSLNGGCTDCDNAKWAEFKCEKNGCDWSGSTCSEPSGYDRNKVAFENANPDQADRWDKDYDTSGCSGRTECARVESDFGCNGGQAVGARSFNNDGKCVCYAAKGTGNRAICRLEKDQPSSGGGGGTNNGGGGDGGGNTGGGNGGTSNLGGDPNDATDQNVGGYNPNLGGDPFNINDDNVGGGQGPVCGDDDISAQKCIGVGEGYSFQMPDGSTWYCKSTGDKDENHNLICELSEQSPTPAQNDGSGNSQDSNRFPKTSSVRIRGWVRNSWWPHVGISDINISCNVNNESFILQTGNVFNKGAGIIDQKVDIKFKDDYAHIIKCVGNSDYQCELVDGGGSKTIYSSSTDYDLGKINCTKQQIQPGRNQTVMNYEDNPYN